MGLFHLLNHLDVFWLNTFLPFLKALLICGKGVPFVFSCDTKEFGRLKYNHLSEIIEGTVISLTLDYMIERLFWVVMLLKPFGSLDANKVQFLAWPNIFALVHWEY